MRAKIPLNQSSVAALGAGLGGLRPDKDAANAAVARWLREIASARVHGDHRRSPGRAAKNRTQEIAPTAAPLWRPIRSPGARAEVPEPIVGISILCRSMRSS
jgi:hypothetical protein